jgi:hypothetical protein
MIGQYTKTVEEHLRKIVALHQRDWDTRLPIFLLAYRVSTHDTSGLIQGNLEFAGNLACPVIYFSGFP